MKFKNKRGGEGGPQNLPQSDNFYLKARKEWDDRYYNIALSKRNWQIAFGVMALITLILAITNARMATESRIQPVVVETCQGTPRALLPVQVTADEMDKVVTYVLDQFIINARSIISDTDAQKAMLDKVYAYSSDDALGFLANFYKKNNPFDLAANTNARVNIIDTSQISKYTWQITFDVITKGNDGGVQYTTRWIANMTYKMGDVNPKYEAYNPFGIYISQLSWAQISH